MFSRGLKITLVWEVW